MASRIATPTCSSFRYRSAQSKWRNPASSADLVEFLVSVASGINVPNPIAGIVPDPPRSGNLRDLRLSDCFMIFLPVRRRPAQAFRGFVIDDPDRVVAE